MAQQIIKICKKCKNEGFHEFWHDPDSNHNEPIFWLICQFCGYSEQCEVKS